MKTYLGAQGEVSVFLISALPDDAKLVVTPERTKSGNIIVGHSESGHHHVIAGGNITEVLERPAPAGMKKLYAILNAPGTLKQDASIPHETIDLPSGIFEFRVAREFDPFAEQARKVSD